uniref:Fibronectin type-III domain-containing protein n=1 Tax=Oryzias latipes TaxID=8090 RepID=A0A3P9HFY2_ORYLA
MSCSSHISIHGCNVTCQLLTDKLLGLTDFPVVPVSYSEWTKSGKKMKCVEADGDTVRSEDLSPVVPVNVTVHLQRGGPISSVVNLTKIVKPKSPQVCNVTFDLESNQTVICIEIPYQNDYLKVENQLFQLHIWTAGQNLIQNVSSQDCIRFDTKHLRPRSQYHVKVRSIPCGVLRGSWSEWSETVSFLSPAGETRLPGLKEPQWSYDSLWVIVPETWFSSELLLCSCRILTFIWPIIPHPKQTLVQICKQHKGLLLSLNPEEFSSLNVDPVDRAARDEELLASSPQLGSTQSSDCRNSTSVSTEELEVSALLSRTSSDSEDSWQNLAASSIHEPGKQNQQDSPLPEGGSAASPVEFRVTQPEEAYVTMSSFYRTK